MLKAMRKHAKYFYILFIIVILTFIFWGVGSVDKSTDVPVATVGKNKITVEEYWSAYERALNLARETYKEKFNEEIEKKLKLKERVLNSLIEDKLLLESAKAVGISVTDEELEDSILNEPTFKRDGVFNRNIYLRTLQLNRLTPQIYEEMRRRELTIEKMIRVITESVDLTPSELKGLQDDKVKKELAYLLINSKRELAIRSFIDGLKRQTEIRINNSILEE